MKYSYTIFLLLLYFLSIPALGQYGENTIKLDWYADKQGRNLLFKKGVSSELDPLLLKYSESFTLSNQNNDVIAFLEVLEETKTIGKTKQYLSQLDLSSSYQLDYGVAKQNRKPVGYADVLPFRKDEGGTIYKLNKFTIRFVGQNKKRSTQTNNQTYPNQSVLSSGNWYKIAVDSTAIFKLDYNDFEQMGFDLENVSSSQIHLHGRPGGMLPEKVGDFRHDDLPEIAIKMVDGGDGTFDEGDYLLFYGESPHEWHFDRNDNIFKHKKHSYSEKNFYFVNIGPTGGKRVQQADAVTEEANTTITSFNEFLFHEKDLYNLLNSGRRWAGEKFDLETSHDFSFDLTNHVANDPVKFRGRFIARSTYSSTFTIFTGSENNLSIPSISPGYNYKYAEDEMKTFSFNSSTNNLTIKITYNKSNSSSVGWLDYIELNFRKKLSLTQGQISFRDQRSVATEDIGRFELDYNNQPPEIWDVTNPITPQKMQLTNSGQKVAFKASIDSLRHYMAFDGTSFSKPELIEDVGNQNLHGITEGVNYIILAREDMLNQAKRLADFHRRSSDLSVKVASLNKVYNEFSSGVQDITAIRDFFKMLYDRGENGNELRYALMFGDGSFDYKDIIEDNTNIIPTYQSRNSLHPVSSYATDDYFGYLDAGEGLLSGDRLDIGLGRLPVFTTEQAKAAVDKIINYGSDSSKVMGAWRNLLTFVGDDEDNNSHTQQANQLANMISSNHPDYNIQKIFFDAYKQESTPGGQRYPDVNEAINTRVEKGALIVNYTGHGGELGWAHERVLGIPDIESWNNKNNLPVFVTATCEFTRFDDPELVSAGELVFLKENGGGIALFTTTRATYGNPNFSLNKSFYSHAFDRKDGKYPRMGDLIRLSKATHNSGSNGRKFILIGDPALQMAYPEYNAVITHVNEQSVDEPLDTIKALSHITMQGEIRNFNNEVKTDFNGIIYPSVYDKEVTITTLANDADSYPMDFKVQRNILYKGKADIKNGKFQYDFVVPKDIDYNMGHGKISLYAAGENQTDANGYFDDIIVGGFRENAQADTQGPDIKLFIDDTTFKEGGITGPNPVLYARISDENGINTVGNGIGHDLIAYVDNREDIKVLNDYYVSDLNRYNKGTVTYPFFNLPEGEHTLYLKAWDVYNNSTEATLDFKVVAKDRFKIQRLFNYPNPVADYTNFVFEHNQKNKELDIEIRIFNTNGSLVKTINKSVFTDGYKISPIRWSGDSSYGAELRKGVYIYKITVKSDEGLIAEKSNKLLLIR